MEVVKYLFRIAISFLLFAYSSSGISSQEELAQTFARFDKLEMDFTQEVYDQFANLIEVSVGKCRISKPSIEWQTIEPYQQSILLSRDTLKIFDPDLEQLIVKKIGADTERIPLNLLVNESVSFKNFAVTKLKNDLSANSLYSLLPVTEHATYYSRIEIETNGNMLKTIKIFGLSGEATKIKLSNNKSLSGEDLILQLEVPKGTDIVDG